MNKKRSIKNLIFAMAGQVVTILAGLVLTRLILISFGSATNGLLHLRQSDFHLFYSAGGRGWHGIFAGAVPTGRGG